EANTYGGSVVVRDAGITFTMTSGKISGGTATAHGSTFAINGAATVSVSDAEITDGELCLYGAGTLTITDSVIGDLKLNAGTVSLSGNKYNTVKAAEGSGFEKILSDGLLMEAPAAELIADGLAAIPGTYEGYAFKIAAEDKLTQFVPTISGTIAEKFGLTLQATASDLAGATVPVLRIAKRGTDVDITDYTVEGGNYVFKFELNAEELTDNLNPRLVVGEVVVDERAEYAAVTYIKALAESAGATASLKTLLADLVEFGAAAQKYYNYNTANLANAEANRWADYAPTDYAEPATVPDLAYQEGDATISVTRASLWLEDDTVAIRFRGVAPADAEFKLNDAAATAEFDGNSFTLTTQALKMSEVSEAVFTVTVTKESVTSSVTYGVATYVSRIRANSLNADMKALAERLWMYGISAKAYY
ncbi:MAG: hypothetical protein IK088_02890, partial [Lachnospiraceae bacterium]|nr:hypothetical protein [Lachnospiraceae bacterium]